MNTMGKIKGLEQAGKGYLNPKLVRACTFYTISTCIGLSTITAILQLGGSVVQADMDPAVAMKTGEVPGERLAGKYSQFVGCPRSDLEACRMLMQIFG